MELGVHLPLIEWQGEGQSLTRLQAAVDAARDHGFDTISVNDHFVFSTPWLDGLTALAAIVERSGDMTPGNHNLTRLATRPDAAGEGNRGTRHPLRRPHDRWRRPRLVAARLRSDRDVVDERWPRFEEAVRVLRTLLQGELAPQGDTRFYPVPEAPLVPAPRRDSGVPLWIGSWGSEPGLRRVARLADGWLASAYNTTPEMFATARELLGRELEKRGRSGERFPNSLVTMWTWVTEDPVQADLMLTDLLAPVLKREPDELRAGLCIGSAEHCAELLSRYAVGGCERVLFWPLGDEPSQIERLATSVRPLIES